MSFTVTRWTREMDTRVALGAKQALDRAVFDNEDVHGLIGWCLGRWESRRRLWCRRWSGGVPSRGGKSA